MERLLSFLGLLGIVAIAWAVSAHRKKVSWRPVIWGVGIQLVIGLIVFSPAVGSALFKATDTAVKRLLSFAEAGADFVFQTVEPHQILVPQADGTWAPEVFIGHISPPMKSVAFWILPTVIFFSALMTILYHYGLIQWVVRGLAKIMAKTMRVSGAESLSASANIFVGQTEAPLVVKPYVDKMTMSELHAIMVGGFATIAGGVMAMYVGFLGDSIPGIAGHLVTASLMSAPAALAIAKVLFPETGQPVTSGNVTYEVEKVDVNGIDALSRGTLEGLKLMLNILAMLLSFVAMIALINAILGGIGSLFDVKLSLEGIFGWLFSPFALLMGIQWDEAGTVGVLLGEKIVLTELIAYMHLGDLMQGAHALSERSAVIASYALCGFANFASIGIQIGGIGGIAPKRRGDLAKLGMRAMFGGVLAAMMTGAVAGIMWTPHTVPAWLKESVLSAIGG